MPDVVVALIELVDQFADLLRRILQVGIQGDHELAARIGQARHHGRVLAEVGVEHHHPRLLRAQQELLPQQRDRTILAAVIDEHDFEGDLQRIEGRIQPREQGRQHGLFVVNRNHDAELGIGHAEPS